MKNLVLSFLLLHAFLFSNAQTNNLITSRNSAIKIDGETSDWVGYSSNYNEISKSSYIIINDPHRVYFLFKFSEKASQMKVLRAGLEINIDTIGKNNFPISVIFPFSIDRLNNDLYSHSVTGIKPTMDFEDNKERLINKSNNIRLIGFNSGFSDVMINKNNTLNVEACIKFNSQNELILEMSIPIKLFFESKIKDYKYPFSFQFGMMGLPFDATSTEDPELFENNSFSVKSKLALPN